MKSTIFESLLSTDMFYNIQLLFFFNTRAAKSLSILRVFTGFFGPSLATYAPEAPIRMARFTIM